MPLAAEVSHSPSPFTSHVSLVTSGAITCGAGGILADDMGLGKTAQLAALVTLNHPECDAFDAANALVFKDLRLFQVQTASVFSTQDEQLQA